MTGCTSGGYDQLETSPETIEQELRPAVCEHRQTDLWRIIVDKVHIIIYIIIRHCPGVGAFPRPFCVPNSVALASLTLQVGDWAIH